MTGIYDSVVGHGEQFGADAVHQSLMVAVGEIRAAVTALENDITCKQAFLLLVPEYQTARRVAGNMQYVKGGVAKRYGIAFVEYVLGVDGVYVTVVVDSEYRQPGRHGLYPGHIQVIGKCLYTVCLLDKEIAENVVKVQMCVQKQLYGKSVIADERCQSFRLAGIEAAGIDDGSLFSLIPDNVCVYRITYVFTGRKLNSKHLTSIISVRKLFSCP